MYLSRLILNPRSRAVQRDLARPGEMHKTVLRAFPANLSSLAREEAKGEVERVLYRLDQLPQIQQLCLLVQSQAAPDWGKLDPGYLRQDMADNPAMKEVTLRLQAGQRLAFRLRANPTKRLSAGKGNIGKRIGIYKVEEQINWLQRKGEQHGFVIQSALPTQQQRVDQHSTDRELKFFSVQFDGILQVTDPAAFLTAIQAGIGSGKAFGFGLLSVAPVR